MKLIIGNKNYSSWSLRGWLAVMASGVAFEEVLIPLDTPHTKQEIARYSPAGRVPILIDDGFDVWDSLAILEYLADKYPAAGLWSRDARTRARQRVLCAEMHSGFAALRSHYPMNMRAKIQGRAAPDAVQADIDRIVSIWREALSKKPGDGPFLFGPFSGADIMFAPVVSRFETYGIAVGESERAYMDAVLAHPHVVDWAQAAAAEPWKLDSEEV